MRERYTFEYRFPSFMSQEAIHAHADLFRRLADVIDAFEPGDRIQASAGGPGFGWEITKESSKIVRVV